MKKIIFLVLCFFLYKHLNRVNINYPTKTCVVTGASSGIGKQISKRMIKKGWKVIGVSRKLERLKKLETKYGKENFLAYNCNVGNVSEVHNVSENIKSKNLKPSLFFLNAGCGEIEKKWKFSSKLQKEIFNVNYFGAINWIDEWLNTVKTFGGGAFVATSSINALFSPPGSAAYSASKSALNSCFQSLRLQYLKNNISFKLVSPGPVKTNMLKSGENLPFKQSAKEVARDIVNRVFDGDQLIETSWFYSIFCRAINLIPDKFILKILGKS